MGTADNSGKPLVGPSDSSDTPSDLPDTSSDSDRQGTGERIGAGPRPTGGEHDEQGIDRIVDAEEAGLGGGLDQAEEAQLGITNDELQEAAGR